MTSLITWLDHDSAAAERSLRILSFFKERESRDELGIGGIRDAIADQLFPGTSTIQTRLRYVFFIPWLYDQLDARATPAAQFGGAAREAENRLLAALLDSLPETAWGVIGREAGSSLKRMPSSVYWAALGRWGFRRFDGTLQQYFAQADRRQALARSRRRRDDDDAHDGDASGQTWHPHLVKLRPESFPTGTDLDLTRNEAEFLLDRWRREHPESLLTWLALDLTRHTEVANAERIWLHPRCGDFPLWIRALIDNARRFDSLIRGASLLYNLQLAELDARNDRVATYEEDLSQWAIDDAPNCMGWNLAEFWPQVLGKGHSITTETQRFVERWHALTCGDSGKIGASVPARQLVEQRERKLKGARSRFANRAALKQWGGAAGLAPLNYRWPTANDFLHEWHLGWRRS